MGSAFAQDQATPSELASRQCDRVARLTQAMGIPTSCYRTDVHHCQLEQRPRSTQLADPGAMAPLAGSGLMG